MAKPRRKKFQRNNAAHHLKRRRRANQPATPRSKKTNQPTMRLISKKKEEHVNAGKDLLSDILAIFKRVGKSKLRTKTIVNALSLRGKEFSARRLAACLKEFGIHSTDIRFKRGVFKGYRKEWFREACQ